MRSHIDKVYNRGRQSCWRWLFPNFWRQDVRLLILLISGFFFTHKISFYHFFKKSRYFLEEDAVDSEGRLVVIKDKSVNKIGHGQFWISPFMCSNLSLGLPPSLPLSWHWQALHELDPAFRKVTLENQRLKELVTDLKFHKDPVGARGVYSKIL